MPIDLLNPQAVQSSGGPKDLLSGTPQPQAQPQPSFLSKVGSTVGSVLKGVDNAGKAVGNFVGEATGLSGLGRDLLGKGEPIYKPGGLIDPVTGNLQQPFNVKGVKQAVGIGTKLGVTAATLGGGSALTALGRIGEGAAIGAGGAAGQSLEENQSVGSTVKNAVLGAVTGAAASGLIEGGKWAVGKVPKLLSYVSDTPESVLQRNYDNPQAMKEASDYVSKNGPQAVLKDSQGAIRTLRSNLTQQYGEGSKAIIDLNQGKTAIIDQKTQSLLNKAAKTFGIELPQNMDRVSANEALKLNVEINKVLRTGKLSESAEGVLLRKAKDSFGTVLDKFTGAKDLISNYSNESATLEGADKLVKAFKTRDPIAQRTALSRLLAVYNENAPSFFSAMKDLEQKTGVPLMDKLAALKSSKTTPASNILKSETVISALKSTFRTFADDLSRGAGRASKLLQTKGPAVSRVFSGLGGVTLAKKWQTQ